MQFVVAVLFHFIVEKEKKQKNEVIRKKIADLQMKLDLIKDTQQALHSNGDIKKEIGKN